MVFCNGRADFKPKVWGKTSTSIERTIACILAACFHTYVHVSFTMNGNVCMSVSSERLPPTAASSSITGNKVGMMSSYFFQRTHVCV
jgi:hypothetical protein